MSAEIDFSGQVRRPTKDSGKNPYFTVNLNLRKDHAEDQEIVERIDEIAFKQRVDRAVVVRALVIHGLDQYEERVRG